MREAVTLFFMLVAFAGLLAARAQAAGGVYVIEGGSAEAQATVRAALDVSRFDFSRIPEPITIRITRCGCAGAKPGLIVLDEDVVLDTSLGRKYAWGLIQHEYSHQVDYSLFQDDDRAAPGGCSAVGTGATRLRDSPTRTTAANVSPRSSLGRSGRTAPTSSASTRAGSPLGFLRGGSARS